MDYTKYVLKSEEELKDLLAEKDNFFVITCNKCFKEFETTQEPECRCLMDLAEAQGKHPSAHRLQEICKMRPTA